MTLPVNTALGSAERIHFVCPKCRRGVTAAPDGYRCGRCDAHFPVQHGVHCFFVGEATDAGADMRTYTDTFRSVETAESYARSFESRARKRWRTRRELAVLERLLGGDPGPSVLNIPCGSGRLSAPLDSEGSILLEADSSPGQIILNRRRFGDRNGCVWLTASAFGIPLPDEAVDTVVCARLSHHLGNGRDRERLLGELLRVARRRVVFSFRNRVSLTSLSRRVRGKPVHATAMSIKEVRRAAEQSGARVLRWRSVSNLGARHSYALIEKR